MKLHTPFQPRGWLGWSRIAAGFAGQLGARDTVFQPNSVSRPPRSNRQPGLDWSDPSHPLGWLLATLAVAEVMINASSGNARSVPSRFVQTFTLRMALRRFDSRCISFGGDVTPPHFGNLRSRPAGIYTAARNSPALSGGEIRPDVLDLTGTGHALLSALASIVSARRDGCCASNYGAKRKTSDNSLRRPFQCTDRASQWSSMQASKMRLRASAGAPDAP
jgi:hypothetical protein